MPLADYERVLYRWINDRVYAGLEGWERDRHVRDTGPFVLGANYGTHPAVRIYYSPEVVEWLTTKNRRGPLPIGSMIVKEMLNPPAARYEERRPADCVLGDEAACARFDWLVAAAVTSWTVMIKDGQTKDGWFWAGPGRIDPRGMTPAEYDRAIAATVDSDDAPFSFRESEHGQGVCLRCHATAQEESTFATSENFTSRGVQFRVDNSWRTDLPAVQRPAGGWDESVLFLNAFHGNSSAATSTPDRLNLVRDPLPSPNPEFTRHFTLGGAGRLAPPMAAGVRAFPGQWADHVPAGPDGADQFITSDNCMGCHGGLGGAPFGVTMFLKTGAAYGDGYNISPFGEWRWSPMGLAGRDPAFFSQLATELAILDQDARDHPERFGSDTALAETKSAVVNTCLSCHGAMGQRQLLIDAQYDANLQPDFKRQYVDAITPLTRAQETPLNNVYAKYGNLAREGISCAVCHHIDPPSPTPGEQWSKLENFLMTSTTGQFPYSPPNTLNGPFDNVAVIPMQNALGITPAGSAYIRDSQMCGTCHTINLPNVDATESTSPMLDRSAALQAERLKRTYGADYAERLTAFPHSIEQATFLEWQNSVFAEDGEAFRSCQDCHMSSGFHSLDGSISIDTLKSQIASIQDSHYPGVPNSLPPEALDVPVRDDYRRHDLVGLNVFLLEMFDQFDPILGVAETDYMTSASTGNRQAIEEMVRQAEHETVTIDVAVVEATEATVTVDVEVTNLVGHRFPSGVGFRRAWIELLALDDSKDGQVVWASGRTNDVGLIVDGLTDDPLPTEFFAGNVEQPHFHGIPGPGRVPPPITRQDQVQIYEEVIRDGDGDVTFSFIHRDETVKDNRLLPRGWKAGDEFPAGVLREFMKATDPEGVGGDPDYRSGPGFAGVDRVRYVLTLPPGVDPEEVSVRATMYYQAFQPFWMKRKFDLSGHDPDTQRLYYLASHLATDGTVIDDWKLRLVADSTTVGAHQP